MSEQDAGSPNGSSDSSNESLNGSWVKLDESYKNGNERPFSIHNGNMENLLAEAAEDRISATHSHRQSLLSTTPTEERTTTPTEERTTTPTEERTTTPTEERTTKPRTEADARVLPPENSTTDQAWTENWASRVEPHPPKKWHLTYPPQKPIEKNQKMSVVKSKTDAFQVNFYIVIPTLLFTHIVAFGIGFYIGRRSSTGSVAV